MRWVRNKNYHWDESFSDRAEYLLRQLAGNNYVYMEKIHDVTHSVDVSEPSADVEIVLLNAGFCPD